MKKRIFIIILLLIIFFLTFRVIVLGRLINYDCKDFKTKEEAIRIFKKFTYDKYDLDRNNNGIPCERLP